MDYRAGTEQPPPKKKKKTNQAQQQQKRCLYSQTPDQSVTGVCFTGSLKPAMTGVYFWATLSCIKHIPVFQKLSILDVKKTGR